MSLKFEDELFEMFEMNSELEEKILKQKEEIEAWAKGEQSQGNTDVAPGGIPVPCKEKAVGLRIGKCNKTVGRITGNKIIEKELDPGGGLWKGYAVKSTGGGMCNGKREGTPKGGARGGSKDRTIDSTPGRRKMVMIGGTGEVSRRQTGGLVGGDSEYKAIQYVAASNIILCTTRLGERFLGRS
jgi:hypothetical protein